MNLPNKEFLSLQEPDDHKNTRKRTPSALVEGVHFYYNDQGMMVFTEAYHLERGYCCKSGCRHCPYGFKK